MKRFFAACLVVALVAAIALVVLRLLDPAWVDRWTAPSFGYP